MQPLHIGIFAAAAILSGTVLRGRWRGWLILIMSLLAVFWLQPGTPIRQLDFWFPVATIALTVLVWLFVQPEGSSLREVAPTAAVIAAAVLLIAATRYIDPLCCITPSRPPQFLSILLVLGVVISVQGGAARLAPRFRWPVTVLVIGIIALLLILKTEFFSAQASAVLRTLTGQAVDQASGQDIRWIGISYIAFRLLSVLLDRQNNVLKPITLREFASYVLFFPTLAAGPIDRAERFAADLRAPYALNTTSFAWGSWRILVGMFKKFVLADTLAMIALSDAHALRTDSTLGLWIMLYAYAFRLYFDFAGYSDIAIGLGRLAGFTIPENFDRPYQKSTLTAFWNSWHMTLTNWVRAYFFNPVSRALRARARTASPTMVIAISQIATMLLIGLWHGVTWNFAIWGLWHGVGLFIHNRWANATRTQARRLHDQPRLNALVNLGGIVLTFHYVALGWVWFALSEPTLALDVLFGLVGF